MNQVDALLAIRERNLAHAETVLRARVRCDSCGAVLDGTAHTHSRTSGLRWCSDLRACRERAERNREATHGCDRPVR